MAAPGDTVMTHDATEGIGGARGRDEDWIVVLWSRIYILRLCHGRISLASK